MNIKKKVHLQFALQADAERASPTIRFKAGNEPIGDKRRNSAANQLARLQLRQVAWPKLRGIGRLSLKPSRKQNIRKKVVENAKSKNTATQRDIRS